MATTIEEARASLMQARKLIRQAQACADVPNDAEQFLEDAIDNLHEAFAVMNPGWHSILDRLSSRSRPGRFRSGLSSLKRALQ